MWCWRNLRTFLEISNGEHSLRYLSNKTAWITKIKRKTYLRVYPTTIVRPDGSTYTARHFEPRRIIKLPLDLSTVSDELRNIILENRKPKRKVIIEQEIEDDFDCNKYIRMLQKKTAAGKS